MKNEKIVYFFFFFQAEDGIRYCHVTGVQTCALPISQRGGRRARGDARGAVGSHVQGQHRRPAGSEERRVGKECRSRWWPDHLKKKYLGIGTGPFGVQEDSSSGYARIIGDIS